MTAMVWACPAQEKRTTEGTEKRRVRGVVGAPGALFAAVDGVVGQRAVGSEVLLEGAGNLRQVRMGWARELRVEVDDEPANVARAGQVPGLLRGLGVGGG